MRERASELDPHASPAIEVPDTAGVKKRFRWRVIPVTILCVFGGASLTGWVVLFGMHAWLGFSRPDAVDVGLGPNAPILVGDLFGVIAAGLWLLTALRLQQGRWWSAGTAFSVAMLLYYVCAHLSGID